MKTRVNYIGEKKGKNNKWLAETAKKVQSDFMKHNQGFILIPWADADEIDSIDDLNVGTCITDCTDPFMFAIAMAGAIGSFAITSDNGDKDGQASRALIKTISDILDQAAEMKDDE